GLQFLPQLLFSMWGGMIADRYPKRRILFATQAAMGALALLLGVLALTGAVAVWQVYLLAFALGMVAVGDSPTRPTFVAEMGGRDGDRHRADQRRVQRGPDPGPGRGGPGHQRRRHPRRVPGQRRLLRRRPGRPQADAPRRAVPGGAGTPGPRPGAGGAGLRQG